MIAQIWVYPWVSDRVLPRVWAWKRVGPDQYKILSLDKIRSWDIILHKLYVILQIGIPSLLHFLSASLFLSPVDSYDFILAKDIYKLIVSHIIKNLNILSWFDSMMCY
jgi:hypothetical protein